MQIKNTDASYCKIKDIKVSGNDANITLIVYSSSPQVSKENPNNPNSNIHRAFTLHIRDKDNNVIRINNNYYWIDRCSNYNNESNNIDINLYKEITIKVDISNSNKSTISLPNIYKIYQ